MSVSERHTYDITRVVDGRAAADLVYLGVSGPIRRGDTVRLRVEVIPHVPDPVDEAEEQEREREAAALRAQLPEGLRKIAGMFDSGGQNLSERIDEILWAELEYR